MKHLFQIALAFCCALTLFAQTKDYGREFRGVLDANQSTRSRPFRIVSTAPSGACTANEWAWSTTALALYHCPSGSWTVFSAGGGGGGDASTNTSSSVDGEAALFSGTAGKTLKRFNVTGVVKATAGVLAAAIAGTDYVTPTGAETLTNKTLATPIIGSYTVAGLPAAGTAGRVAIVTDAAIAGSCASGGGSARSLCRDTGSAWEPLGDGSSGAATPTRISITDTSSTRRTIGANCTVGSPCRFAVGTKEYSLTASALVDLGGTSASGAVELYLSATDSTMWAAHSTAATVTCTGCTTVPGTATIPIDAGHIGTLQFSSNVWTATSETNYRQSPFRVPKRLIFGSGMSGSSETADTITLVSAGGGGGGVFPDANKVDVQFLYQWGNYEGFDSTWFGTNGCAGTAFPTSPSATFPYAHVPWIFSGGACSVYHPKANSTLFGYGPFHGSSPVAFDLQFTGGRFSGSGDVYFAFASGATSIANSFGVRWNSSTTAWECYVNSGGSVSGTVGTMSGGNDTAPHRFRVNNNGGAANTVRCSIDGGAFVTVTSPTIPTPTATWSWILHTPTASTAFSAGQFQMRITY
jgi:hypothetical protein